MCKDFSESMFNFFYIFIQVSSSRVTSIWNFNVFKVMLLHNA